MGAQRVSLSNEHLVYTLVLSQRGIIATTITRHKFQNGDTPLKAPNFFIYCHF